MKYLACFLLTGCSVTGSPMRAAVTSTTGIYDVRAYGATGDGMTDDSAAINLAVADAVAACGGEVLFPLGRYRIAANSINVFPPTGQNPRCSIRFTGYGTASQILVDEGTTHAGLYAGNMGEITIDHLAFITGSPFNAGSTTAITDARVDALDSVLVTGTDKVVVRDCLFLGLQSQFNAAAPSTYASVQLQGASVTVEDNRFLGCAGGPALQVANWTGAVEIDRNQFLDYGNLNGVYYSKTPHGEVAWIGVGDQYAGTLSGASSLPLLIRECGFDEGARPIVFFPSSSAKRWDRVRLEDLNVYGPAGLDIFTLPQINRVQVVNCGANVRGHNYAIVDAQNCGDVRVEHFTVDKSQGGAATIEADAATQRLTVVDDDYDSIASQAVKTVVEE